MVILGPRAPRPQLQRYQATLNRRIIRAARSLRAMRPGPGNRGVTTEHVLFYLVVKVHEED